MASNASSFTSPLAEKFAAVNVNLPPHIDFVVDTISNAGILTWLATLLALAVAYDQSMRALHRTQQTIGRPLSCIC